MSKHYIKNVKLEQKNSFNELLNYINHDFTVHLDNDDDYDIKKNYLSLQDQISKEHSNRMDVIMMTAKNIHTIKGRKEMYNALIKQCNSDIELLHLYNKQIKINNKLKKFTQSDTIDSYLEYSKEVNAYHLFTYDIDLFDRRLYIELAIRIDKLWNINDYKISFELANKIIIFT